MCVGGWGACKTDIARVSESKCVLVLTLQLCLAAVGTVQLLHMFTSQSVVRSACPSSLMTSTSAY